MTSESSLRRFPALRGTIGDWYYYITTLSLEEVAARVRPATELVVPSDMNSWIQRRVVPRRARQIADYLIDQDQHFFPSIVVGVYLGDPTWYEINVEENPAFSHPTLENGPKNTLGILELDGTEKLYAIDGQHRVAGIRNALQRLQRKNDLAGYKQLASETLSLAFVSAYIDDKLELERIRRLFTTLNKQAKKVSEPEIVALDEDDPAAIVTRWIATDYHGLKAVTPGEKQSDYNLIQLGTKHEIRASNRRSVTTIVTLYRMIRKVFQPELQKMAIKNRFNRPEENKLKELYREAVSIWELLRRHDKALNDVLGTDPSEERAGKYRTEAGGHILFRPVGLQAFSGALGVLRGRGIDNERAVRSLCQLPTEISKSPWEYVVWNPSKCGMISKNNTVAEALFLHMVGEEPRTSGYRLGHNYKQLLVNPSEDPLQEVPIYALS